MATLANVFAVAVRRSAHRPRGSSAAFGATVRGGQPPRAPTTFEAVVVLAITLPIIPIHAFFGVLISVWTALALLVAVAGLRARHVEPTRFAAHAVSA